MILLLKNILFGTIEIQTIFVKNRRLLKINSYKNKTFIMFCQKTKNNDFITLRKNYEKILEENNKLKTQINSKMEMNNTLDWSNNIDDFVEQWYEENKETIDIGVIDFRLFKIDLFPDYLEKHIYKKILKIMFSFFMVALSPKS